MKPRVARAPSSCVHLHAGHSCARSNARLNCWRWWRSSACHPNRGLLDQPGCRCRWRLQQPLPLLVIAALKALTHRRQHACAQRRVACGVNKQQGGHLADCRHDGVCVSASPAQAPPQCLDGDSQRCRNGRIRGRRRLGTTHRAVHSIQQRQLAIRCGAPWTAIGRNPPAACCCRTTFLSLRRRPHAFESTCGTSTRASIAASMAWPLGAPRGCWGGQ